eukprot:3889859-Prymnesium_polylepis.1
MSYSLDGGVIASVLLHLLNLPPGRSTLSVEIKHEGALRADARRLLLSPPPAQQRAAPRQGRERCTVPLESGNGGKHSPLLFTRLEDERRASLQPCPVHKVLRFRRRPTGASRRREQWPQHQIGHRATEATSPIEVSATTT